MRSGRGTAHLSTESTVLVRFEWGFAATATSFDVSCFVDHAWSIADHQHVQNGSETLCPVDRRSGLSNKLSGQRNCSRHPFLNLVTVCGRLSASTRHDLLWLLPQWCVCRSIQFKASGYITKTVLSRSLLRLVP